MTGVEQPEIDMRLGGGELVDGKFVAHSLSGNERNHLFLSREGKRFTDVSLVSGLDTPADSRGFVLWDYDRDGWQDVALVNANAPLLNVYRNRLGDTVHGDQLDEEGGSFLALRFRGANRSSQADSRACRDGFGALVTVALADKTIKREHRCGEGYATQNSQTMIVGLGNCAQAKLVTVRWPSGAEATIHDVAAGTMLTLHENKSESPDGTGFGQTEYRSPFKFQHQPLGTRESSPSIDLADFVIPARGEHVGRLIVMSTMATWCESCKKHLPQHRKLRDSFDADELTLLGIPIDATDTREKLAEYVERWSPAYELVRNVTPAGRDAIQRVINESVPLDTLPSSLIMGSDGHVLTVMTGLPTVSEVRKHLRKLVATNARLTSKRRMNVTASFRSSHPASIAD